VALIQSLKPEEKEDGPPFERRLVFNNRRRGRLSNMSSDSQIGIAVCSAVEKLGVPMEAAVADAMKQFGLQRKAVFEAVKRYKKRLPSLYKSQTKKATGVVK
jgi:hypothetical protein